MEKRPLGNTGLQLSIVGFGGFHLIEVPRKEAAGLLNTYLDRGGNYIETAAQYGEGISERKVGEAVSHRRNEFILATKTVERSRGGALSSVIRQPSAESVQSQLAPSACDKITWPGAAPLTHAKTLNGTSVGFKTKSVLT